MVEEGRVRMAMARPAGRRTRVCAPISGLCSLSKAPLRYPEAHPHPCPGAIYVYDADRGHARPHAKAPRFSILCDDLPAQYLANNKFITALAQLNFFYWVIRESILDYIEENAEQIKMKMNKICMNKPKRLPKRVWRSKSRTRRG